MNRTDYDAIKDRLEMAEVLDRETDSTLEVRSYNESSGKFNTVIFKFNDDLELIEICTED